MEACDHKNAKRHGFAGNGKQRWKCNDCAVSFVDIDRIAGNNRLPREKEDFVLALIADGKSVRQIRAATIARFGSAISHWAIHRRMVKIVPPIIDAAKVGKRGRCDFCGQRINGQREFDRRTRRTRHKFCTQLCYRVFWREVRGKRRCKKCGVRRDDIPTATKGLTNRMCPRCYAKSRQRTINKAVSVAQLAKLGGTLESTLAAAEAE